MRKRNNLIISIPFSADWAKEIVVVADEAAAAEDDEDDDDDAAVCEWCESCKFECLPSIELLFLSADEPSLSFDFDFSPNFDEIRSLSACISDSRQKHAVDRIEE